MKVFPKMLAPFAFLVLTLTACNAPVDSSGTITPVVTNPTGTSQTTVDNNSGDTNGTGTQTPVVPTASVSPPTIETEKPLALIYKGPGSCSLDQGDAGESGYGCSEASADAATLAGFRFKYVGPKDLSEKATAAQVAAIFGEAKVWIQPGGVSDTAYYAMTSKLRSSIVSFVQNGGGYVGFCAGAFLATDWFNLMDASSSAYNYTPANRNVGYAYLNVTWNGKNRVVYFEGGPYLKNLGSSVEVTAKFSTGYVEAARAAYGKGRVYLSGGHPEAPAIWGEEDGLKDPDGSDLDIAADMVTWAAGLE